MSRRWSNSPRCLLGLSRLASLTNLWSEWEAGRDRALARARWQIFDRANSIGRRPASASSRSLGVVLRAPVMARAAMRCAFRRALNALTEPEFLAAPASL